MKRGAFNRRAQNAQKRQGAPGRRAQESPMSPSPLEAQRQKRDDHAYKVREGGAEHKDAREPLQAKITEHRRAEEPLRKTLQKLKDFESVVNRSPAVIFLWRAEQDGPIEFVSDNVRQFGYTAEDFISGRVSWRSVVHPEDVPSLDAQVAECFKKGTLEFSLQFRLIAKSGDVRWLEERAIARRDSSGVITHYQGVVLDVTERKKVEEALRYRVEFERLIAAISTHFLSLSSENVDAGINHALRLIGEFAGVDRSYVFRINNQGPKMSNTHEWCSEGIEPHIQRLQGLPVEQFPWLMGFMRKFEVMHIPRVADLPPKARAEKEEFEFEDIKSIICVPMAYGKALRGFVGFDSVRVEKVWSSEDARLLQLVGEIICLTLERIRAEESRLETEHKYRTLFMDSLEAMCLTVEGRVADVNPAWLRMLGFPDKNEVLGMDVIHIVHPDDQNTLIAWRNMPDRDILRPERLRNVRKDGTPLDVEVYSSEVLIDGRRAILTTVRDITERKHSEERIQRHVQRLAALRAIDIAISASLDLRATLSVFLGQVASVLDMHAGAVLLINPHSQVLEYAAGHGFISSVNSDARFRLGEDHPGRAALERRTIYIPNLQESAAASERSRLLASEGFVSYRAVPLIAKGKVNGVLELFHRAALEPDPGWSDVLDTLAVRGAIAIDNATLFDDLQRSHEELILAYDTTLEGWSRALDMRDETTEGHTQRGTDMVMRLARKMGVGEADLVHIRRGALLHDIGKMAIPDSILLKPATLSKKQRNVIRKHPVYAFELLAPITFLRPALDIPLFHHENWDGTGYPRQLKGEQIPLAARIFAVVDTWDSTRSMRPYRAAWSDEKAREYILEQAGKHFDPKIVKAFFEMLDEGK